MSMTSMSGSNNVVVIGGGAAGMMAAGTAASFGAHVTLLEPNGKLGKKLFITGKGRCNVTNNCTSDEVLKNVPVNPRFLYSALSGFSPADAMAFFEAHGCKLKTERGNRVFPESDQAGSVIDALRRFLKGSGAGNSDGKWRGHGRSYTNASRPGRQGHSGHRRLLVSRDRLDRGRL